MILIFLSLFFLCFGGVIYPKTPRPIIASRNNMNAASDYTFYFQISSYAPSSSILTITFPYPYPSGLGITTCSALNWNQASISCSVSGKSAILNVGELSNANANNTYSVTIYGVKNPSMMGGTGMFSLQTSTGINIIDYCDWFGELGITSNIKTISSASVSCTTNCKAGQSGTYDISFTNAEVYEVGARLYILFPTSLTLSSTPSCTSTQITGITCKSANNLVTISALTSALNKGANTITFTSVGNPAVSGNVGTFDIYSFQPVVNTMYDAVYGVTGPTLTSNFITSITACPTTGGSCTGSYPNVGLGYTQYYYINFVTTNPIPYGGAILLTFVSGFTLRTDSCNIYYGLSNQGYTEDDQILCNVDTAAGTLTITKFAMFLGGTISLKVIATNPTTSGTYSSFSVSTYYDTGMTQLIDTGTMGSIVVANFPQPNKWDITWSGALTVGNGVTASIIFQPKTSSLSAPSVSFQFNFPTGFSFNGTPSGLWLPNNVFPDYSATVTASGSPLVITFATAGTDSIPTNKDNRLQILSSGTGIVLPSMPGHYFIEMITLNGGSQIEGFLYEMIVLPASMSGSAMTYSIDTDVMSLYEIKFTPLIDIPSGSVPDLPQQSWGTIDVQFPTMNSNWQNLWPIDLGTGGSDGTLIACKGISNIEPFYGSRITCKLLTAASVSTSTYVTVRITNFKIIYAYVPVTVHISNIINPATADIYPYLTVVSYSITQRVYQTLNSATYTHPLTSYSDNNPSLPIVNGRSQDPYGDGTALISFAPNTVNMDTIMSFILWTEGDIQTGGTLLIKFPSTYPLPDSAISCYINYKTAHTCYTYPVSGWISILNTQFTIYNHVEYTVTVHGLTNPVEVVDPAMPSMVVITGYVEEEYVYFHDFNYFDPGAIDPVHVFPSSYNALATDITYTWLFTCADDIPAGGKIVLTFPKTNYVLNTYPTPTCLFSGLDDESSTSAVTCTVIGNTIEVTNFATYTAGNEIQILVFNVLNPATTGYTDYFQVATYSTSDLLMDAEYYIPKILITAQASVGLLTFIDFYANPNNGGALGDYTVSILPSVTVPNGSYIIITFPSTEFSNMATSQTCTLSGGLTTLSTCYSDGNNIVTVITDDDYVKNALSAPINITVHDITNFAAGLTSGVVDVEIYSSGVLINTSPENESNRKVTTGQAPGKIYLKGITSSPDNPDELAIFNLTFSPATSFNSSCYIIVDFPSVFARDLSEKMVCSSPELSNSTGTGIICAASGYQMKVYNTKGFDVKKLETFTISLNHLRNPKQGSGQYNFIFYTACGYEMQDYGTYSYTRAYQSTPANMYLSTATTTGTSILYASEQVYLVSTIASYFQSTSNDLVFIDFPLGYDEDFVGDSIVCKSDVESSQNTVPCTYESNRVKVSAFSDSVNTLYFTEYGVSVIGIENPDSIGQARFLKMSLYMSSQDLIFAKTFDNLNRADPFYYNQQGILVTMNSGSGFSLNAGTRTWAMNANIDTGSPQSVSITPTLTSSTCYVVPSNITFSAGDFIKTFQVSCDISSVLGYFYIEWNYDGTWPRNYWSPIPRTKFQVTDNRDETITIGSIGVVPQGGESFPIPIALSHPVDKQMVVALGKIGIMPTGSSISPNYFIFEGGDYEKTFVVGIDKTSYGLTGQILVEKSGVDEVQYSLTASGLTYAVGSEETTPPIIADYQMTSVSKTTAGLTITVDTASNVYWMLSRYGTRDPTASEAKAGALSNAGDLHDTPVFGHIYEYTTVATNRLLYNITVSGLKAQTNYTMHFVVINLGGVAATKVPNIVFTTTERYRIATFPIKFNQTVTQTTIDFCLTVIALQLRIDSSRLGIRADYSGSTGTPASDNNYTSGNYTTSSGISTRLLADPVTSLDVLIYPDPYSTSTTSPLDYANMVQDKKSSIQASIQEFDTSLFISGKEIYGIKPVFMTNPKFGSAVSGVLKVLDISLYEKGIVFVCVTEYNSSETIPDPIPWQVVNGLNSTNYPCEFAANLTVEDVPEQVSFSGLQKDKTYKIYLSGQNTVQEYPDLMDVVKIIPFTTNGMSTQTTSSGFLIGIEVAGLILLIN
ncbi:unnamed protein product [Blepharisma stoltei]|uniref:Uncharacterized protein n=1 Tax=Blepharisma stoltei TaxID=1481888 RepID=A0AAU9J2J1_9CILI|nr:unnamed protein product [Blepharisma stoltei]